MAQRGSRWSSYDDPFFQAFFAARTRTRTALGRDDSADPLIRHDRRFR